MFYAQFVLAKKGPLAKIWLAAHWDKKLTKAHVFETNIESSVEGILQPKVKMALRTSGHLLLGIVRIYSRKAKYLLQDCNEAFIKIKMAFRPGVVDLPEGNREAAVSAITLPEVFHDFDLQSAMPDLSIDMDTQVTLNQSRAEDITLKEEYGTLSLMTDDGFDMGFDEPEAARDVTNMEEDFEQATLLLNEEQAKEQARDETVQSTSNTSAVSKANASLDAPLRDDGFGGTVGEGLLDGETGGLFEPAGLFDDAPLGHVPLESTTTEEQQQQQQEEEQQQEPAQPPASATPQRQPEQTEEQILKPPEDQEDESDDDMYDMGPGSTGAPSPPTSPESPPQPLTAETPAPAPPPAPEPEIDLPQTNAENNLDLGPPSTLTSETAADLLSTVPEMPPPPPPPLPQLEHTTLIQNEDESFALAPLDTTIMHGVERTVKAKRKRKLIVDEIKNISGEEMKAQLSDTSDIVTTLDLAPPTKRLMHWKETGGVEKLFALPGHQILSKTLSRAYSRHLTTRSVENEDFGIEDDKIDLDADLGVEQPRDESDIMSVSRKRPRRDIDQVLPQDLSHLDTFHLEASRQSYASDHSLTHPAHASIEVPNFLQPPPHHMFPPLPDQSQHMMNAVMQHPPPAHMIQQMLQHPDVNQLGHIPDMMHPHPSMVDQGPPLHSITPSLHNVPSPVVSEAYNQRMMTHPGPEPIPDHLLQDQMHDPSHMQQPSMDKQLPHHSPLNFNQINSQTLPDQLPQPQVDHLPYNESNLPPCADNIMQPQMNGHVMPESALDEDVTQPCLAEEYSQAQFREETDTSTLPNAVNSDQNLPVPEQPPVVNDHDHVNVNENEAQNCIDKNVNQTVNQVSETDALFDSLNNGERTQVNDVQNEQTNEQVNNENALNKSNEYPASEDDDDYEAPGSVGPQTLPEEQMADETYEQFEERVLTKRTTHMLHIINNHLDRHKKISFADVIKNNKRKQVAQKFYTFLVLKKQQAVELEQSSSYGDLIITKGPKFSAVYNSN